ncbi:3-oxo-5-alpha-steroid 4-dehydrogenase 1 [Galdieria sulphuraria]|nr:3-oxo-5-alpha-steroid 4-dehydrogenase 1 [Galdieria sulphuraria]
MWNIDLLAHITLFEEEIYDYLFLFFLFLGAITFPLLLVVDAPYGKLFSSSWGPTVRTDVGWIIQEAPAFFLFLLFALKSYSRLQEPAYMLLSLMFLGHYLQLVLSALGWNVINGYLVGRGLFHFEAKLSRDWYRNPIFIVGALCWLCGFIINLHSDHILRNLRKPGEKGYKIPHGGLFRWVSCANYFGEMVEWSGWALASQSLAGALFVFWTVANLLPRAIRYHQWYIQKFSSYVTFNRKACIPFLI